MRAGLLTLVGLALMLGGCAHKPVVKEATDKPVVSDAEVQAWRAFEVKPGMTRAQIEAGLGEPDHLSRSKDGHPYAMYEMKSYWKSVIYDEKGVATIVYP